MLGKQLRLLSLLLFCLQVHGQTTDLSIAIEAQNLSGNAISQVDIYEDFQYVITVLNSGNSVDNATISVTFDTDLTILSYNSQNNNADITFLVSDMFTGVKDTFDMIVCNPPYISETDYIALEQSVREYEPAVALKSGDGYNHYRIIAKQAGTFINEGGALVLEIGAGQSERVVDMLTQSGFKNAVCQKDYQGRDRIVTAYK